MSSISRKALKIHALVAHMPCAWLLRCHSKWVHVPTARHRDTSLLRLHLRLHLCLLLESLWRRSCVFRQCLKLEGSLRCELGLVVEGEDGGFVMSACRLGVEWLRLGCVLLLWLRCESLLRLLRWRLLRRLLLRLLLLVLLLLKERVIRAIASIALRVLLRHVDLRLLLLRRHLLRYLLRRGEEVWLLSIHGCR